MDQKLPNDDLNIILLILVRLLEFISWVFAEVASRIRNLGDKDELSAILTAVIVLVLLLGTIFTGVTLFSSSSPEPARAQVGVGASVAISSSPLPSPTLVTAEMVTAAEIRLKQVQDRLQRSIAGTETAEDLTDRIVELQKNLDDDEAELKEAKAAPDDAEREVSEIQSEIKQIRQDIKETQARLKKAQKGATQ